MNPVPITASLHFDDVQSLFRVECSRLDPKGGGAFDVNKVIELIQTVATLVEVVAIIADFLSGIPPTTQSGPTDAIIGDWRGLADWAAARAGGTFTPAH